MVVDQEAGSANPESALLPPHLRVSAYAVIELLLDTALVGQRIAPVDLESLLILFSIAEVTMRPLVLGANAEAAGNLAHPPEDLRGATTRRLMANRLGLPRESVRRKVNALIKAGFIVEDEEGQIRIAPILGQSVVQTAVTDVMAAVSRYRARLEQFGVPEPEPR